MSTRALPAGGRVAALALACHPLPTAAVTVLTSVLATISGRATGGVGLVALTVLAGQLSVGWSNDARDVNRDAEVGRRDKPAAHGRIAASTLWLAAGIAAVAAVPLSFANGTRAGGAHLVGVAAAWSYNLWVKSTRWSFLPFTLAFGLLPVFVWGGLPGAPWPPWWLPVATGLLGTGAHFANALPDLDDDLAGGIRGLPHRLPRRLARSVMAGLFVVSVVVVALGPAGPVSAPGWSAMAIAAILGALAYSRAGVGDRTGFALGLLIAVVALVLLAVELGRTHG